jgi:predicted ATP-dependent serine protease
MSQQTTRTIPAFEKVPTGIDGFDEITDGGILRSRTTLMMENPGSGKTVFDLQRIEQNLRERLWSQGKQEVLRMCGSDEIFAQGNGHHHNNELESDSALSMKGRETEDA